ncbi:hypothetical protein B566_EDAN004691 [Ephemera danica]|nr:hypothetical protein B566_EDAN004691 [Ephemera danica]
MASCETHECLQDTFLDIDRMRMEDCYKSIEIDEDPFDEEYLPEETTKRRTEEHISFLRKKLIVEYWLNNGRLRTFSCVQNRFREVQYRSQLNRWKEQVDVGGTRYSKLVELYHLTYAAFEDARVVKRLPVHDLDLRRFALNAASEIGLEHFRASRSWIFKFKKTYNIVSRKVTKFITTKSMRNIEQTIAESKKFIQENKPLVEAEPDSAINGDQSGFQRELRFGRVLEPKGSKIIDVIAQSANSLTHSSTVMPFITASGKLLEPVLLCIQERNGCFPPTIEAKMQVPENLIVVASKSGKMEKRHVPLCLAEIVLPNCSTTCVTNLFLDSWSGHSDLQFIENMTRGTGKVIAVKKLPPGSTKDTQPLDKYGLRPWKVYQRKISEYIILNEIDFILGY